MKYIKKILCEECETELTPHNDSKIEDRNLCLDCLLEIEGRIRHNTIDKDYLQYGDIRDSIK